MHVPSAKVALTKPVVSKAQAQSHLRTKVGIGLVDFFDRDLSDSKQVILPKNIYWFDRTEFHKKISERIDDVGKINRIGEKLRLKTKKATSRLEEGQMAEVASGNARLRSIAKWTRVNDHESKADEKIALEGIIDEVPAVPEVEDGRWNDKA